MNVASLAGRLYIVRGGGVRLPSCDTSIPMHRTSRDMIGSRDHGVLHGVRPFWPDDPLISCNEEINPAH